ncbi:MAG: hypothetical protein K2K84_02545 [Muribaculaceae bacterium]|nr:hypothetical protein [Muribaculaceae bacterium]
MIARLFKSLTTRADSTNLVGAIARSVRRPDLDIEDKIELVISAGNELMTGRPVDEEHSLFILSLADSIYTASAEVAAEFADDWDAIRGLANVDNGPWVQYSSRPLLLNYALSHPDSLQINSWIVTRILETDSIAELGPIIENLTRREPDNVSYRMLYPVWLNNMGRHEEAAAEYSRFRIDDIRRAVRRSLELNGQAEIAEQDTATFEEMVGDVWFATKSYHSQTLFQLGRMKDAAEMLEGVLDYARDPNDRAMSLNNIAYYLGEDGRSLEHALALADSSLTIKRAVTTLDTRAWILHKLGRDKEAYDDMMQVLADRPKYGANGEVNLTLIVDHEAMYDELKPVLEILEIKGESLEAIDSETLANLIYVLGHQVGIEKSSIHEYLLHLFHICLGLGDDYAAYSVGLWMKDLGIDDEEYETRMKQFEESAPPAKP